MENISTKEHLTPKEVVTFYANVFRDKFMAVYLDFHLYINIKKIDPGYTKAMPEFGRVLTVDELINLNKAKMQNISDNIALLVDLDKKGTFDFEYNPTYVKNMLAGWDVDENLNLVATKKGK